MVFQEWLDYGKGAMRNVSWRAEVQVKGQGSDVLSARGFRETWLVCSRDDSLWVMPEPQLDQGSVMPGNLSVVFIFQFSHCLPQLQLSAAYELHVNYYPNLTNHAVSCAAVQSSSAAGSGCSLVSFSDLSVTAQPALI